jgi:hypothetical protein
MGEKRGSLVLVGKSEGKSPLLPSNIEGKMGGNRRHGRRRKQWIALSGKLALDENIDLSKGRLGGGGGGGCGRVVVVTVVIIIITSWYCSFNHSFPRDFRTTVKTNWADIL